MSRVRRVRYLVVAVLALASLLILMSRQIGDGDFNGRRSARRSAAEGATDATAAGVTGTAETEVPDLSFYDTLGVTRGGGGRSSSSSGGERLKGEVKESVPAGAYVIQVLATHDLAQATQVKEKVVALGLPARVIEGEAEGKIIYRVRVSSYRERRTAVAWAEKIEARIGLTPWVLQEAR